MITQNMMIDFTRGYIDAILWSSGIDCEDWLSDEFIEEAQNDCLAFIYENDTNLSRYCEHRNTEGSPMFSAGHDFALTRNGHGAGFWDRLELPKEIRDELTESSKSFGEAWPYIDDNGMIDFD